MQISKLLDFSIIKTVRFNFHYFGLKSVIFPKVIVSRHVLLREIHGQVLIENEKVGSVRLGFRNSGFVDEKNQRTVFENRGKICFKGNASIGAGCAIVCEGQIIIGKNLFMTATSQIIAYNKVVFGDDVLCSWNCTVMDTDFHQVVRMNGDEKPNNKPINIGDHVWIGCNVLVLKGAVIGQNSVVAAGSKVLKAHSESVLLANDNEIEHGVTWKA